MPQPSFTIFVLLRALPSWLALSRIQRREIGETAMKVALGGTNVTHRHYDAEAFSAFCSDIAAFQTDDLNAFNTAMERLRDSPIFALPHFELIAIIPAIEDGYRHFEQMEA